ncbi:MAG: VPLPA-CTERM sorting domain-containing protein [Pseudomonadota bacterium]
MLRMFFCATALCLSSVAAMAASVSNVTTNPMSPVSLGFGDGVDVTFDYDMMGLSGRIFARPFNDGVLSSAFSASPSGIFTGTGTETVFFTIQDLGQGFQEVDQIRFQILSDDLSILFNEQFFDVDFAFGTPPAVPLPAAILMLPLALGSFGLFRRKNI